MTLPTSDQSLLLTLSLACGKLYSTIHIIFIPFKLFSDPSHFKDGEHFHQDKNASWSDKSDHSEQLCIDWSDPFR